MTVIQLCIKRLGVRRGWQAVQFFTEYAMTRALAREDGRWPATLSERVDFVGEIAGYSRATAWSRLNVLREALPDEYRDPEMLLEALEAQAGERERAEEFLAFEFPG